LRPLDLILLVSWVCFNRRSNVFKCWLYF